MFCLYADFPLVLLATIWPHPVSDTRCVGDYLLAIKKTHSE
jgi:hypothetical protein